MHTYYTKNSKKMHRRSWIGEDSHLHVAYACMMHPAAALIPTSFFKVEIQEETNKYCSWLPLNVPTPPKKEGESGRLELIFDLKQTRVLPGL
jgi:hypothetical protein